MINQFPGNLEPNTPVSPKRMILSAAGVIAILLVPFIAVTVLWHDRCPSSVVQTVASPGGTFVAEQIIKDCGKTMPKAAEVHLFQLKDGQRGSEKTVLVLPTSDKLTIAWNAEDNVAITLPDHQSQVVSFKREWKGVHIALIGDIISSVPKEVTDSM
jgi:hypothetical protein